MNFVKTVGLLAVGAAIGICVSGTKKFKELKEKAVDKYDELKAKCEEKELVDEIKSEMDNDNKVEK